MASLRLTIGLLAFAAITTLAGCDSTEPSTVTVQIRDSQYILELALDDQTREHGLMGREYIAPDGGMLFVFPRIDRRGLGFWMGYCLSDMDVIFLDAGQEITAMHRMTVEPARREGESETAYHARLRQYGSRLPAQYAIELAPGTLDLLEPPLEIGEWIEFDGTYLKGLAK
ncbi:MAG: DUF192 domain-containing protein [Phycisphaerales bacterium]|nr:DUF192 domain-containing protein [Phycisphaerales bacterium]